MSIKKNDFPFFMANPDIIYLDNASTVHKPQKVLDAVNHFYTHEYANVGRGTYSFAEHATEQYETVRQKVAHFINAKESLEIVFTSGTTESINTVAWSWASNQLIAGDEIVITALEHHANILCWQALAAQKGLVLSIIPIDDQGVIHTDSIDQSITQKTKLIATTYYSNAIGTRVPVEYIAQKARSVGACFLIDAAQAAGHVPLDVQTLDCDFLAFSGHKMGAPTGVGVLYIAKKRHAECIPFKRGGGMVFEADYTSASYKGIPALLEAGTPPIAQVIGLGTTIDYLQAQKSITNTSFLKEKCIKMALEGLLSNDDIRILGPIEKLFEGHIISFLHKKLHAHDVAAYFESRNICLRAGHHCAQPLAKRLGYNASTRLSLFHYNDQTDIEAFLDALKGLKGLL